MNKMRMATGVVLVSGALMLSGCGTMQGWFDGRGADTQNVPPGNAETSERIIEQEIYGREGRPTSTIWDIFGNRGDAGQVGAVNKYIWNASLDVLDFLPVESVDPFTGVISTGYGTPPGGGRAYRATIYVSDPALDARSLNVAIQTRSGPVDGATVRAVEDAILTRARQLRARDSNL
ncbi:MULTISPECIES: DUF3576 domain-containing protein [Salipiger]|jgi:predicted small secreted protein|uniref:DUF3576 protein n=1 Tax=Salipiger profundus TaxID=1229727 RepID=A0A1U7D5K9_9RHOB|nr:MULTISPECIES: DUF3576 domain-containing protein [Salipiger]APX23388.1 protein of unknown function (DUF3576) [Salipiger profundus]GGA24376.1 hypothetical protein GCM10011326_40900 [Salipiger profundus]SFD44765.1 protein of unknown function [Salipiger profundus]